ncbi:MAG TPA: YdcF family protein [Candidatus Acidoferrales bacterium]
MIEPKSRLRRWLIPGGVLTVVVVVAGIVFFTVGGWLVVEDPLAHADVILVLSGRLPERAVEAARIYEAGYAEQVWISPPIAPVDELKAMNISYLGEDFYNEKVLMAQGVPPDSIRVMDHANANTEAEVRQTAEALRALDYHSVIIVTSKAHTRRVRTIWRKLVGAQPHMIVRFAQDDTYDGAHWWRHTQDALDVTRETLGLLNAWAGFPLRPSQN